MLTCSQILSIHKVERNANQGSKQVKTEPPNEHPEWSATSSVDQNPPKEYIPTRHHTSAATPEIENIDALENESNMLDNTSLIHDTCQTRQEENTIEQTQQSDNKDNSIS